MYKWYRNLPMKDTKQMKRANLISLVLISAIITIGFVMTSKKPAMSVPVVQVTPVDSRGHGRSEQDVKQFAETNLFPLLRELYDGKCPFPEVQQRFNVMEKLVRHRFGKNVHFRVLTTYANKTNTLIIASALPAKDKPEIAFAVPSFMDLYEKERAAGPGFEERSCITVLSACMHEFDHLEVEPFLEGDTLPPFEQRIQSECVAWDKTCRFTLGPMLKSGRTLAYDDAEFYRAWQRTGQNSTNQAWVEFIRKQYQPYR